MTFPRFRRAKFGNTKTTHSGRSFDSKSEANCFDYLKLLEKAGEIRNIETQVTIDLVAGIRYRADFKFFDIALGEHILGDYKGFEDAIWKLKKKLYREFGPFRLRVYKGKGLKIYVDEEIVPRQAHSG